MIEVKTVVVEAVVVVAVGGNYAGVVGTVSALGWVMAMEHGCIPFADEGEFPQLAIETPHGRFLYYPHGQVQWWHILRKEFGVSGKGSWMLGLGDGEKSTLDEEILQVYRYSIVKLRTCRLLAD